EKIIQIPFVLPRIRTDAVLDLAKDAFDPAAGRASDEFRRAMSRLVRLGMDRNPRRVKRFINAYSIASGGRPLENAEALALAKVLVIRTRFPDLYRRLAQDPGLIPKLWEEKHDMSLGDGSAAEGLAGRQKWNELGVGHLFDDFTLRRFLEDTADIRMRANDV